MKNIQRFLAYSIFASIISLAFYSCEDDDICTDEGDVPRMVADMYYDGTNVPLEDSIYYWAYVYNDSITKGIREATGTSKDTVLIEKNSALGKTSFGITLRNNSKKEIRVIVDKYYSSLKKGDLDQMLNLFSYDIKLSYDNLYQQNPELKTFTSDTLKIVGSSFDYEIEKVKIKDNKAVVTIKETGLDKEMLDKKIKELTSKESFIPSNNNDFEKAKKEFVDYQMNILSQAVKEVKEKKSSATTLTLEKEKSGWVITTKNLLRVIPKDEI